MVKASEKPELAKLDGIVVDEEGNLCAKMIRFSRMEGHCE